MKVIPFEAHHADALRKICLQTAGEETLRDPARSRYVLAMYCDCYLAHGTAFVLTDDDSAPRGYILAAEDITQHTAHMAPYLAEIEALGGLYPLMAQAELAAYRQYAQTYPAHLHIDILEAYTGNGNGSALMQTLLAALRSRGVPGLMLQVSVDNERAIGFYKKNGFQILSANKYALVMGQQL